MLTAQNKITEYWTTYLDKLYKLTKKHKCAEARELTIKKNKTMPYKSKAQREYVHIHLPKVAKRWDKENPSNAKSTKLPKYKKKKKS